VREESRKLEGDYNKTEDDLKAIQNVGQIIGEVLKQIDEDKCEFFSVLNNV
jgi:26S proteasome regulatory subunit T4